MLIAQVFVGENWNARAQVYRVSSVIWIIRSASWCSFPLLIISSSLPLFHATASFPLISNDQADK